jgi:hypothetical protein
VRTKQKACKVCLHGLRESIEHDLFLVGRGPGYLADCVRHLIQRNDITRHRDDCPVLPKIRAQIFDLLVAEAAIVGVSAEGEGGPSVE